MMHRAIPFSMRILIAILAFAIFFESVFTLSLARPDADTPAPPRSSSQGGLHLQNRDELVRSVHQALPSASAETGHDDAAQGWKSVFGGVWTGIATPPSNGDGDGRSRKRGRRWVRRGRAHP